MRFQRRRMSLASRRSGGSRGQGQVILPRSISSSSPVAVTDDGRECCRNNAVGHAEYTRRKQLLWEQQDGRCEHCGERMRLDDCRLTHGSWTEMQQQGYLVLRDDRLHDREGRQVNWLVHKSCLRDWHRSRSAASGTTGSRGKEGSV